MRLQITHSCILPTIYLQLRYKMSARRHFWLLYAQVSLGTPISRLAGLHGANHGTETQEAIRENGDPRGMGDPRKRR
jgi:hypothetical protein